MSEERIRLQAQVAAVADGDFEIVAITAGNGNGWEFSREVLQKSAPLWDGAHVFVDHDWEGSPRSVRDLCGVMFGAQFDDWHNGIVGKLKAQGASGAMLNAIGREWLMSDHKADVGFSADVIFTAEGMRVVEILRVMSVDLVFDPARGGLFIRALNQRRESGEKMEASMSDEIKGNVAAASSAVVEQELGEVRKLMNVQAEQAKLQAEIESARKMRVEMCSHLLQTGLAASGLPAPMQENVRAQFEGKAFEIADLNKAIDSGRKLAAELTAGSVVQGVGRLHGMFSTEDQIAAAVDDLFDVARDEGAKSLKVAKLSGIRELYFGLTGDDEMHGGYYPSRKRFATTADFAGLVKNALNKIVVNQWKELGRAGYSWWEDIVKVEHFESLQSITGTLVGTVGSLPTVAERGEYTELAIGDSPETASFTKYGGYIPLTLELIDRDETRKLKSYARELANAGLRKISGLVAAVFTDNSDVGPTLADTGALFNSTAVTTAGGHVNLLTTALSAAQWSVVRMAIFNAKMLIKNATGYYGTGPKMAIYPRYCLIPANATIEKVARDLFLNEWDATDNKHMLNTLKSSGEYKIVPEWVDADNWAAVADPRIAPAIYVGERFGVMPEIFIAGSELSPAVFTNDEHRIKVRQFCAVWVNDFRPLHKSNV